MGAAEEILEDLHGRIAKTLAVRAGDHLFLLCTRGNARLDNDRFSQRHGFFIIDLQVDRHYAQALAPDGGAHGLIQHRGRGSTVDMCGRPLLG